ncbi:MAG: carboxypeptidase regulatory-like domain-containing protein [Vicinamibacterales bacterium]
MSYTSGRSVRRPAPVAVRLLATCALVLSATPVALAQVGAGAITGVLRDATGQAIAGAAVTIAQAGTGATRTVRSNTDGTYVLAGLAPDGYNLTITADGFRPSRALVQVATGATLRLDVTLDIGPISAAIEVDASRTPRQEHAGLGHTVEGQAITGLPLNGRSFVSLVALSPGVALPPGGQLPRINGGRPRTNEYLFDGISVLQPEPGQVAFFPVIDAIQEFRIERNSPPAEFGRFNGGVVNLTTKSGTNALHGTAFGFVRHDALNARNYFQAANATTPDYRRGQYGGTVGGPVVRHRLFFFADYQGQRQRLDRTVISTVPTLLQRQGIFTEPIGGRVPAVYDPASGSGTARTPFAGNTVPSDRFDPVAASLLARYPLPTGGGTANNYRRTAAERDDQDQWDVRVDHVAPSSGDQIFGRASFFRGRFTPVTPLPDGSGVTTVTLGPQRTAAQAIAVTHRRAFSPFVLHETRAGDTRRRVARTAARLDRPASVALGLPGIPSTARFPDTLPTFLIAGYQQLGSPANTATDFQTSVTEVANALTWLRGRHTFKAGLDWRWSRLDVVQPPSPTGSFTFNALGTDLPGTTGTGTPLASFLLGQVQAFSIDLQHDRIQERARVQEYFVQDDWKVSSRLTVNAGVRYTLNFPSTEINGQTAVFDLTRQVLTYPGREPVRPLKKANLGPRLGASFQPADRLTLSGGYGLVWIEMAGITTPFTTPTFPFLQTVAQRALDTLTPAFVLRDGPTVEAVGPTPLAGLGQGVFAVNADLGSGYVQQWHASARVEIGRHTEVQVSYAGSAIANVGIPDSNLNQLTVEQLAQGSPLLQRVANPWFGTIPRSSTLGDPTIPVAQLLKPYPQYSTVSLYRNNVGTTAYRGLELSARRRMAGGLSASVSYTRSVLKDDASSVFDASILTGPLANAPIADSGDLRRERDYSNGDIPHVFVASLFWEIPAGRGRAHAPGGLLGWIVNDWTVTAILTAQSGLPVAVRQATNFNAFAGFGIQRPNLIGDPELPADERTPARWFNTDAFAVAPQFTLGSASRNPVRGPGYQNVDLAVARRIPAGRVSLELRAEAFNLLNRANFNSPAAVIGAADFGSITSALDPRVVQVALKLLF